jgi:aldose 1-epimerase
MTSVLPDGRAVASLTIGTAPGPVATVTTLGAAVETLEVTGGDGVRRNVVLGHADVADRLTSGSYLGGTIGRYANRIAGGRFVLDGRQVEVAAHDRGNSLHGGPDGFDRRVWEVVRHGAYELVLALVSPDGDQGFPGTVSAQVRYLVEAESVHVEMTATTDAPTVVNLTNHAYFNLDGEGSGTVDGHLLAVHADEYTPVDDTGIPLGDHAPVAGTPFDLRVGRSVGAVVREPHPQVAAAGGLDHDFVVRGDGLRTCAVLESPATGTRMRLLSDRPGLQVYTGNSLDGTVRGTSGRLYRQGDGVALEPQVFPDSPNRPEWPSAVLRPGEEYAARLAWVFSRVDPGAGGAAGSGR